MIFNWSYRIPILDGFTSHVKYPSLMNWPVYAVIDPSYMGWPVMESHKMLEIILTRLKTACNVYENIQNVLVIY
jgi:hypothetical protein